MIPSLPLPTDNFYKFVCFFGFSLVLAGVVSFFSVYSSSLDAKTKILAEVIELESITPTGQEVSEKIKLKKRMLDVTILNERSSAWAVAILLGVGSLAVGVGGSQWYSKVQLRDDEMGQLQLRKVRAEVEAAESKLCAARAQSTKVKDSG